MNEDDMTETLPTTEDDPRFDERWFRSVPETRERGSLLLVGVVHDHPSSVHRAAETVAAIDPDVVALELPQLAMPLFERHASRADFPPRYGGEMTAAIQGSDDARVVGIDAPNRRFIRELTAYVGEERPGRETLAGVVSGATPILRHALRYRIASVIDARTHLRLVPDRSASFDVTHESSAADQAEDERRQLSRSRTLLSAVELPQSVGDLDRLRESTMARRIEGLREEGDVVAVVGFDHLDPLHDRLDAT
ncbi:hypothetical protein [Haloarchaeobius sp. HRN-SO-5]|uniref:hypothetical protein n=1 Tax=Haloarchaeobius sp. HRN-SO-5 TaxID=3446118 RepID=UPI003EB6F922